MKEREESETDGEKGRKRRRKRYKKGKGRRRGPPGQHRRQAENLLENSPGRPA
jgi:hypothetical protein